MRLSLTVWFVLVITPLGAAAQSWPTAGWPHTTPEAVGLDEAPLAALDAEFVAGKVPLVDDFLVARCGAIA